MNRKHISLAAGVIGLLLISGMAMVAGPAIAGTSYSLYSVDGSKLNVLDPATGALVSSVDLGVKWSSMYDVAFSNGKAYVTAMSGSIGDDRNEIAVVDLAKMTVKTIHVDSPNPKAMALGSNGMLYVATEGTGNSGGTGEGTIYVIDTATDRITGTVNARQMWDIVVAGNSAYATYVNDNAVAVLDLGSNSITKTIDVQSSPTEIAAGKGGKLYVLRGNIGVIDTATNTMSKVISPGDNIWTMAGNGAGNVYLATGNVRGIDVINPDTDTVVATVPFSQKVTSMAIAPDGLLYASYGDGTGNYYVGVVDTATNTVTKTLALPKTVMGLFITAGPARSSAGTGTPTAAPAPAGGSSTPGTSAGSPTKTPGFELAIALIGIGTIVVAQRMKK